MRNNHYYGSRSRIGHGNVRYVGPLGCGYFLVCLLGAFIVASLIAGFVYLFWPYVLGVLLFALLIVIVRKATR